jgi:Ankyrin repeats (many copies)
MPPKPSTAGGAGDRRSGFLAAVKAQKLDTVRWSLTHGGQTPGTRDDDGFTAIHIAAASNKQKVLQLMLDLCRRSRELELIDLADGSVRGLRAAAAAAPLSLLTPPLPGRGDDGADDGCCERARGVRARTAVRWCVSFSTPSSSPVVPHTSLSQAPSQD